MQQLRHHVIRQGRRRPQTYKNYFPGNQPSLSAINLSHYLALREQDLRPLREQLAAAGVRAESDMLNKGPYIIDAVRSLHHLLAKMQAHEHKKFSRLRALHW